MTEISDSLRLLYETTLEKHGDQYTITIPDEIVEESSLTTNDVYRVALLTSANDGRDEMADSGRTTTDTTEPEGRKAVSPPVEEGEVRSVTIDTLGDQGDGIAKVERGFIVIVPGTQPGDKVEVEIADVKETVAFADPVAEPKVR